MKDCKKAEVFSQAYNGNNSVYVLDDNGFKLFNSNQVELIKGHNVFSVLQNMKYLHNSSFDKTKAELEKKVAVILMQYWMEQNIFMH